MNLKQKIRIFAGIIGAPVVVIAQIFILFEDNLTVKQTIGAYLTIFTAICVIISIMPNFLKKR